MKKSRLLWNVVLITTICSICWPSNSIARSSDDINKPGETANRSPANDEKMLINPKYNCDPKMIIPGNPDIDPNFLLKHLP